MRGDGTVKRSKLVLGTSIDIRDVITFANLCGNRQKKIHICGQQPFLNMANTNRKQFSFGISSVASVNLQLNGTYGDRRT
jgi:hypothetical protein